MLNKVSKIGTENLNDFLLSSLEVQVSMMQQHLDICKIFANTLLSNEVDSLAGSKYSHEKPLEGRYSRWGHNPESVKVGGQRVPIQVPRVFDNQDQKNVSLESYEQLRKAPEQTESMVQSVLHGISMRDYQRTAETLVGNFGISPSSVSRELVDQSAAALEEFQKRRFEENDFVALFIDGKYLAGQQMIIVLGITSKGQKIVLGITQTSTENHRPILKLLTDLIDIEV
jgi:transposase-like protein